MLNNISYLFIVGLIYYIQKGVSTPVKVITFYESLCPDSIRFFKGQLEPTYRSVGEIMTVEVHAFGKASSTPRSDGDGYTFQCQHGPAECYGNIVLECGQKWITDHHLYLNFTFCVMSADNPSTAGEQCATLLNIDYDSIGNCANSTEGELLLHKVELLQSQLQPSLYFVPWIIINDEFSGDNLSSSIKDLKKLVCNTYEGTQPAECSKPKL